MLTQLLVLNFFFSCPLSTQSVVVYPFYTIPWKLVLIQLLLVSNKLEQKPGLVRAHRASKQIANFSTATGKGCFVLLAPFTGVYFGRVIKYKHISLSVLQLMEPYTWTRQLQVKSHLEKNPDEAVPARNIAVMFWQKLLRDVLLSISRI